MKLTLALLIASGLMSVNAIAGETEEPVKPEDKVEGEVDQGEADHGETDQGETDQGETDQGETDQGETDQGETDQGETDQGETDQGETDQGDVDQGDKPDQGGTVQDVKVVQIRITPFKLAHMARQGYFKDQGIPSYATFCQKVNTRGLKSEDIMASYYARQMGTDRHSLQGVAFDKNYARDLTLMMKKVCRR